MNQKTKITLSQPSPPPGTFAKKIGSTMYNVSYHFNQDAREDLNAKLVRLIKSEAVKY